MSRFQRDLNHVRKPLAAWRIGLLALNVALLAVALYRGRAAVVDGQTGVTTGFVVAAGIGATFLAVGGIQLLAFPPVLIARLQVFALGAQALHAIGHLARLYYVFWFYDDILHFGLVLIIGILAMELMRSRKFLLSFRAGPIRVAFLVWLVATAAAGLWEIFEFTMDVLMGTREQDDLFDTMVDMIDGTAGGVVAGLIAARAVRAERRARELGDARSSELLD